MLHKFVFGSLGWTPYEYYTAAPYELFCACEGFFDKEDRLAQMMRIASYRIHQSLVQKPLRIDDYWPLYFDNLNHETGEKISQLTQEDFDRIKKVHGIN